MRHWFGGGIGDYAVIAGDLVTFNATTYFQLLLAPNADTTFWTSETGGTQYVDLRDPLDVAIDHVTTDGFGAIPRLRGPEDVTAMWAQAGGGPRRLITATDLGDSLAGKVDLAGGRMTGELRLLDDSPAASKDYVDARAGGAPSILPFAYTGIVSVRTGVERIYNDVGRPLVIGTVRASVGTAPAGQSLIVDVNKGATTIYTAQANRPAIAAGANTGTGGTPDITAWGVGEYLTIDVDQVGTATPGSNLTVTVVAT